MRKRGDVVLLGILAGVALAACSQNQETTTVQERLCMDDRGQVVGAGYCEPDRHDPTTIVNHYRWRTNPACRGETPHVRSTVRGGLGATAAGKRALGHGSSGA